MKIYIAAHKDFISPVKDKIYVPIQVGAKLHGRIRDGWLMDDTGWNISEKNSTYNELTGLYWVWRNSNEDIVGLCHYRRYFVTLSGKLRNLLFRQKTGFINRTWIERRLSKYDLIVHNKTFCISGVGTAYRKSQGYVGEIESLHKVLKKYHPAYVGPFRKVMGAKTCHLLNMMIGRKEVVDQYCVWLFDVLQKMEAELARRGKNCYERRLAMFAERMLDIWIVANNLKVKEIYSINTERVDWKMW